MTITPVALFTYNRPEHTSRAFRSLERCSRLAECSLHVYCDGPKGDADKKSVDATREIARQQGERLGATVIERESNLGLARSLVEGVTGLCERFGRAIVIEDDLVLHASFLDYMLQALDRYAHEPNVYQISGYMFPVTQPSKPDAFFLPLITTWGWATWRRAWQIFDWDANGACEALKDPALRKQFDLSNSYPYAAMLERQLSGLTQSWGILFWWHVFKAKGLALHPRQSFVSNGGFDGTGTNCSQQGWSNERDVAVLPDWANGKAFDFPSDVVAHREAFNNICSFLRKEQYPASLIGRIRRKLRPTFGA
jgi:hypothetical protein